MSESVWYVGIGSMMNGTGLRLRGIQPSNSYWCEILDHRRIFYGPATLVPESGETVHAVAHEMAPQELKMIEAREPPSKTVRIALRSGPNAGAVVDAAASVDFRIFLLGVMAQREQVGKRAHQETSGASATVVSVTGGGIELNFSNRIPFDTCGTVTIDGVPAAAPSAIAFPPPPEALPSARYISLMVEGARAVDMDPAEIQKIASTPCSPRKSPSDLSRIPISDKAQRLFSDQELRNGDYRVFRGLVLAPEGDSWWRGSIRLYNGTPDVSFDLSRQIYDPFHGIPPESPYDPWGGWSFIEDIAVNGPWLRGYVHVGWVASAQSKPMSNL